MFETAGEGVVFMLLATIVGFGLGWFAATRRQPEAHQGVERISNRLEAQLASAEAAVGQLTARLAEVEGERSPAPQPADGSVEDVVAAVMDMPGDSDVAEPPSGASPASKAGAAKAPSQKRSRKRAPSPEPSAREVADTPTSEPTPDAAAIESAPALAGTTPASEAASDTKASKKTSKKVTPPKAVSSKAVSSKAASSKAASSKAGSSKGASSTASSPKKTSTSPARRSSQKASSTSARTAPSPVIDLTALEATVLTQADAQQAVRQSTGARSNGISDDLTRIHGIGPKISGLLLDMGITSYAQVASLSEDEIELVSAALGSFGGRVRRDDWMAGARALMDESPASV